MDTEKRVVIDVMILLCIISTIIMIFVIFSYNRWQVTHKSEFIPPDFEKNVEQGLPDVTDELGWSLISTEGLSFQVGISGNLVFQDNSIQVFFTNMESNNTWLKLRVIDCHNKILSETGVLKPGEYIRNICLYREPEDGEKVRLKVMAFEPVTYYSEGSIVLNTEIHVGG